MINVYCDGEFWGPANSVRHAVRVVAFLTLLGYDATFGN